ncbi:MAG: 23S rRNA (adenine(1618)-N(6))-methyltransferase RlmF [Acidobacteria bacterium]|nr:23S rRNA (adenine(1618)-N(6))-methyltransferase RlmF [Acidobacteriota bacterium]
MHPRNRFRTGYDVPALVASCPALEPFVRTSPRGEDTINFADPGAVMALNQALLKDAYGLRWSIPRGALCPPIPSRCDYIHHLADLLSGGDAAAIPRGRAVRVLDIGTGANCIYPLIGASEYGWSVVGTEIDKAAMHWARQIVRVNSPIASLIECRLQPSPSACLVGVAKPGERFAASMCNPPFHASAAEAAEGSRKKRRNLGFAKSTPALNFGGQAGELWCTGGEVGFIQRLIAESAARPRLCRWFTTLVSKSEHLPRLRQSLTRVGVTDAKVIDMAQGQKKSRILAWTFSISAFV